MTTLKDLYNKSATKIEIKQHDAEGISEAQEQIKNLGNVSCALFIAAKDINNYLSAENKTPTKVVEDFFDISHKVEYLNKGYLGNMLGIAVFTDANFAPEKQFITNTYVGTISYGLRDGEFHPASLEEVA